MCNHNKFQKKTKTKTILILSFQIYYVKLEIHKSTFLDTGSIKQFKFTVFSYDMIKH